MTLQLLSVNDESTATRRSSSRPTTAFLRLAATTITVLLLLVVASSPVVRCGSVGGPAPNFVAHRWLNDGEHERFIHRSNVWVKETAVDGDTHQLRLWQGSDGKRFVQAIYDSDHILRDCEMIREPEFVSNFLSSFDGALERAHVLEDSKLDIEHSKGPAWNETLTLYPSSSGEGEEEGLEGLLDVVAVRKDCKELHRRVKTIAKRQQREERRRKNQDGGDDEDDDVTNDAKMKFAEADRKMAASSEGKTEVGTSLNRLKRELFIYPGTNWCGIGATTEKYNDLGLNAAADRCCRQHDYCAHIIEGFSTKYNLFNYRFHTLSHCDCDERFRTCLKMVNNGAGNMVGRLFFNIVQMRCFVLKSEKTCTRRSWWGKCLKYEYQKTAHLKDALPF